VVPGDVAVESIPPTEVVTARLAVVAVVVLALPVPIPVAAVKTALAVVTISLGVSTVVASVGRVTVVHSRGVLTAISVPSVSVTSGARPCQAGCGQQHCGRCNDHYQESSRLGLRVSGHRKLPPLVGPAAFDAARCEKFNAFIAAGH
jgi:hypothetical protein